jgi:hypothetical protein
MEVNTLSTRRAERGDFRLPFREFIATHVSFWPKKIYIEPARCGSRHTALVPIPFLPIICWHIIILIRLSRTEIRGLRVLAPAEPTACDVTEHTASRFANSSTARIPPVRLDTLVKNESVGLKRPQCGWYKIGNDPLHLRENSITQSAPDFSGEVVLSLVRMRYIPHVPSDVYT